MDFGGKKQNTARICSMHINMNFHREKASPGVNNNIQQHDFPQLIMANQGEFSKRHKLRRQRDEAQNSP
jgi:hypothetical protein